MHPHPAPPTTNLSSWGGLVKKFEKYCSEEWLALRARVTLTQCQGEGRAFWEEHWMCKGGEMGAGCSRLLAPQSWVRSQLVTVNSFGFELINSC